MKVEPNYHNTISKVIGFVQICITCSYMVYAWTTFILILNGNLNMGSIIDTEIHFTFCLASTLVFVPLAWFWLNVEKNITFINKSIRFWKELQIQYSESQGEKVGNTIVSWKQQLIETIFQLALIDFITVMPLFIMIFYVLDPYNQRYPVWIFVNSKSNIFAKFVAFGTYSIIGYYQILNINAAICYAIFVFGFLYINLFWLKCLVK